jgi:hypothetical protein
MMCKFENVQMCKLKGSFLSLVFVLLFVMVGYSQAANYGSNQFKVAQEFTRLLKVQKTDSILTLIAEDSRKDSSLQSELREASTFLSTRSASGHWIYVRVSMDPDIVECQLLNGTNIELRVTLIFTQGTSKISHIETLDQAGMKRAGIATEDLDPPPPAPEPPQLPRPK